MCMSLFVLARANGQSRLRENPARARFTTQKRRQKPPDEQPPGRIELNCSSTIGKVASKSATPTRAIHFLHEADGGISDANTCTNKNRTRTKQRTEDANRSPCASLVG